MTLTKAVIVEQLCLELFNEDKSLAKEVVEIFFEQISRTLEQGEEVKLSGFGNFSIKDKNSRPGRNPKTGEPKEISARKVVTFHAGQKLRTNLTQLAVKDN